MSKSLNARRLDVAAFARAQEHLADAEPLQKYERLAQEVQRPVADLIVHWQAEGGQRKAADGSLRPAIHLRAQAVLPLTCQRCMAELDLPLAVDRHFVFVADEDSAAALDDESDDDVLVAVPDFDLRALVEDELLMALPLVPRHEACPEEVALSAQDADFEAAQADKPHPFASLAALKDGSPRG